ncbi:MAG: DUF2147 domain-containing protein [Bacteroidota bacterium]
MPHNLLMFKFLLVFFLTGSTPVITTNHDPNFICGKWISTNKDFIVLVYRDINTFKAKTVWFKNKDTSKAMDEWTDKHNPDPALRTRKLIGMNIMTDLIYNARSDSWEDGKIYDSSNGHVWSAAVKATPEGHLKITGYWHFKFIGRSMMFTRMQ